MEEIESQAGKLIPPKRRLQQCVHMGCYLWHTNFLEYGNGIQIWKLFLSFFCVSVCAEVNLRHEPELQEGYEQLQRKYAELEDLKSRFDRSYAIQNEKMLVRLIGQ